MYITKASYIVNRVYRGIKSIDSWVIHRRRMSIGKSQCRAIEASHTLIDGTIWTNSEVDEDDCEVFELKGANVVGMVSFGNKCST
jgi:hypothetical protein